MNHTKLYIEYYFIMKNVVATTSLSKVTRKKLLT